MIDDLDKQIIEYTNQNLSPLKISKQLGIDKKEVVQRSRKLMKLGAIIFNSKDDKNKELNERIKRYLKFGLTPQEVADKLGLSVQTIYTRRIQIEAEQKIELPRSKKGRKPKINTSKLDKKKYIKKRDTKKDEQIIQLLEEGLNQSEIAKKMGVSHQAISSRLKRFQKMENQKLALMILNLIKTKNATIEQIKILGDYYGIDIFQMLNSLNEQER